MAATFVAQSGKQTSETKPIGLEGCTPAPKSAARIRRLQQRPPDRPDRLSARKGAPDLRQLRVLLPDALKVKPSASVAAST